MSVRSTSVTNKVYKFVHKIDEEFETSLKGRAFVSKDEWLKITEKGKIFINASKKRGYAWDGCTPKFEILDMIFGVPDGKLDYLTQKPITYYASMVHDMLYQFKKEVPLSRKEADLIFLKIMQEGGFMLSTIYYIAVRILGGLYGSWPYKSKRKDKLRIFKSSWIVRAKKDADQMNIQKHKMVEIANKYT